MQTICFNNSEIFSEFKDVHTLLEQLHTSDKTLEKLTQLFFMLKQHIEPSKLFTNRELPKGHSHFKEIFLDVVLPKGQLIFEALYFTGDKATVEHTHPEYIIDQVLSGSILEVRYEKQDGRYIKKDHLIRNESDTRSVFDPYGSPHKVCAINGPCISLCLSYGKQKVEPIKL